MRKPIAVAVFALAAAFGGITTAAAPGGAAPALELAMLGGGATADCAVSRDPLRCDALRRAREACQGKRGAARRDCMDDQRPPVDCTRARYPQRCEAREQARLACTGKSGRDRHECLRGFAPGPAKP